MENQKVLFTYLKLFSDEVGFVIFELLQCMHYNK